jgi:N-acetylglucosaminyldiphosphoundecaprenol N-acetyl-beta-D-mannosaminyltransferase
MLLPDTEKRKQILGIEINDVSTQQMRDIFHKWMTDSAFVSIVTPNPEFVLLAHTNDSWKETISEATLSLPDGVGLQFASIALTGEKIEHRQTGVDAVKELCEVINEKGGKILLVGDDEHGDHGLGALGTARKMLELIFSRIQFVSVDPGRITRGEYPLDLAQRACDEKFTAVLVALPMPVQLNAIELHKQIGYTGIVMGVGGALDMLSGVLPRAPHAWQKVGLEWMWRFLHEPRRYKRMYRALIVFPYKIAYTCKKRGHFLKSVTRVLTYFITRNYVSH